MRLDPCVHTSCAPSGPVLVFPVLSGRNNVVKMSQILAQPFLTQCSFSYELGKQVTHTVNLDKYINKILYLPGTPDAFGSLCTYFMCSIRSSPEMQSFWQMGQQLGLGPPTNAVCC